MRPNVSTEDFIYEVLAANELLVNGGYPNTRIPIACFVYMDPNELCVSPLMLFLVYSGCMAMVQSLNSNDMFLSM